MKKNTLCVILFSLLFFSLACRKEQQAKPGDTEQVGDGENGTIAGFYLLNEGNMNMNKASLDYYDYASGQYRRDMYGQANPDVVKGLGDVGNDVGVYGSKLYVVVNVSNKVDVLDVKTGKRLKQINLGNCRYVTFHKGKAYVSAYLGSIGDPNSPKGIVAEIDTASLAITRRVTVGRQPEEMAVVGEKLYVANSGGYSPPDYERTLSVVDLNTFTETRRIDVGINLNRVKADAYGDLYVTSRGDYYEIPSRLYVVDTQKEAVKKAFDIPAGNLTIDGDKAYIISADFNYKTGENTIRYSMLDVRSETPLAGSFITDGTEKSIRMPYGIAINPETKDILLTDARDYVTPGMLYCFGADGRKKWSVSTGDIPAHFAFIYKK
ncbi:MAG: YncE family protein [Mucilaginibacter polytrichastri]|nr:YncE family protein [Mucilaginibacter polytrichastri]